MPLAEQGRGGRGVDMDGEPYFRYALAVLELTHLITILGTIISDK